MGGLLGLCPITTVELSPLGAPAWAKVGHWSRLTCAYRERAAVRPEQDNSRMKRER